MIFPFASSSQRSLNSLKHTWSVKYNSSLFGNIKSLFIWVITVKLRKCLWYIFSELLLVLKQHLKGNCRGHHLRNSSGLATLYLVIMEYTITSCMYGIGERNFTLFRVRQWFWNWVLFGNHPSTILCGKGFLTVHICSLSTLCIQDSELTCLTLF